MCVAYRIQTNGEKKEVWRLTLGNVSTAMAAEDTEKEQHMYKDVSSQSGLTDLSLSGLTDQSLSGLAEHGGLGCY